MNPLKEKAFFAFASEKENIFLEFDVFQGIDLWNKTVELLV